LSQCLSFRLHDICLPSYLSITQAKVISANTIQLNIIWSNVIQAYGIQKNVNQTNVIQTIAIQTKHHYIHNSKTLNKP
jgi:hypothetical protein